MPSNAERDGLLLHAKRDDHLVASDQPRPLISDIRKEDRDGDL
jgi:hypothetical protein